MIYNGTLYSPNMLPVLYYSINNGTPLKSVATNLPNDEDLTISFGIQNGEAVAKTMTIDYITMMVER